jgi:hypothetical protein
MQGTFEAEVTRWFQAPELHDLKWPGIIIPAHVIESEGGFAFFSRHGGDSVTDLFCAWRDNAARQPWTKAIIAGMFLSLARLHGLVSFFTQPSAYPGLQSLCQHTAPLLLASSLPA